MIASQLTLIFLMLAVSTSAFAHRSHHGCGHGHSCSESHDPALEAQEIQLHGISERELKELMDSAHHAIESEDVSYWQKVKDKANFKKIALRAYRWASENEDRPEAANARSNIAVMLLASHLAETVGGFAMAGYGVSNGLQSWLDVAMTVSGILIPIPGLDPMCIVLIGTYSKYPRQLDRLLTKPRVLLLRGAQAANAMAGLPNGWADTAYSALSKKRFLQRYLTAGDVYSHRFIFNEAQFQIHGTQEGQIIELTMTAQPSGKLALTKVRFNERAAAIGRTYLAQLLAPFGMNIKAVVLEIDQAIADRKFADLTHLNYVEKVDPLADRYTVFLTPGTFPFHNLREEDFGCETRLMTKMAIR